MLPVLPPFLLLAARMPAAIVTAQGGLWVRLRRLWPATRGLLLVTHGVALLLAVTSQSQASSREAMQILRADQGAQAVISLGPEIHDFFLARPDLPQRRRNGPEARWLAHALSELRAKGVAANRVIGFAADHAHIETILSAHGLVCDQPQKVAGWWLDRLIYRTNPRHNRRRSSVLIWRCELPAYAWATHP